MRHLGYTSRPHGPSASMIVVPNSLQFGRHVVPLPWTSMLGQVCLPTEPAWPGLAGTIFCVGLARYVILFRASLARPNASQISSVLHQHCIQCGRSPAQRCVPGCPYMDQYHISCCRSSAYCSAQISLSRKLMNVLNSFG